MELIINYSVESLVFAKSITWCIKLPLFIWGHLCISLFDPFNPPLTFFRLESNHRPDRSLNGPVLEDGTPKSDLSKIRSIKRFFPFPILCCMRWIPTVTSVEKNLKLDSFNAELSWGTINYAIRCGWADFQLKDVQFTSLTVAMKQYFHFSLVVFLTFSPWRIFAEKNSTSYLNTVNI